MEDRYLNKAEVCRYMGISVATLNRWRKRPDFPQPVLFGERSPRWKLATLDAYASGLVGKYSAP